MHRFHAFFVTVLNDTLSIKVAIRLISLAVFTKITLIMHINIYDFILHSKNLVRIFVFLRKILHRDPKIGNNASMPSNGLL